MKPMIETSPLMFDRLADDASVRELMRPLLPFLDAPDITEVAINEPGFVLTETDRGWTSDNVPELDYQRLLSLTVAIATFTHQDISPQHPILSAMLPAELGRTGHAARIQLVIPPAVPQGTVSVTIRRPSATLKTLDEWARDELFEETVLAGMAPGEEPRAHLSIVDRQLVSALESQDYVGFFKGAVKARKNIAIVGDTGSGKTTFMKTLCQHIPATERLLTIEDVHELLLPNHNNCVHLFYSKGEQGQARVKPADLIASAMRMKPDRVLLAELRGSEAYDFLKLLTTGHSGSITSYHAQSRAVAIERFALMVKEHPEAAIYADTALKRLLSLTIDIVAHIEVRPVSMRRVVKRASAA
jgi:type IV secretion system protein VirB11